MTTADIKKGDVFGCWVVLRASSPDGRGRARFMCRSSCCGREKLRLAYNLAHRPSVCVHCKGNGQKPAAASAPPDEPAPAPRLRTLSDEVSELRGALIAMLWNVVGGDTDETCDGTCVERGAHGDGTPFPACAAVRALGWAEHFDARSFEQRASR